MSALRWKLLGLLLLIACVDQAISQVDTPFQEEVDVTLVSVYLTALDSNGRFVTDLRPDELIVREGGEAQTINQFGFGDREIPLTIAFLVDNSTSISAQDLGMAKNAGLLILKTLRAQDKMVLVSFRKTASVVVGPTFEKNKMEAALLALQPQYGSTALFDALAVATGILQNELGKKFLILLSDGQDNASQKPYRLLESRIPGLADVSIVSFGTVPPANGWKLQGAKQEYEKGKNALEKLAYSTGGLSYFPSTISQLQNAIQQLREAIQNQYIVAYSPTDRNKDGSWREIEIQCSRPRVTLSYRRGYYVR